MAKKTNKRKKQDIIIKSLQNCFQEFDVPLEVVDESKEIIMLMSPILIGVINFHVALIKKRKIATIIITNPKRIAKSHLCTLIEFANRLNKMYCTIGYLTVDTETRYINMRFAVELIDERLDTNHLKICFNSVLGQVAHYFGFVESANVENSTSKDLMIQYIAYSEGQNKFENITNY
jgi:RNase H-fold protein (predicted Holliday junction resolvase)